MITVSCLEGHKPATWRLNTDATHVCTFWQISYASVCFEICNVYWRMFLKKYLVIKCVIDFFWGVGVEDLYRVET